MKELLRFLLLGIFLLGALLRTQAQSRFAGVLLTPVAPGIWLIGGNIHFTVTGGQVAFQSTIFQYSLNGATIEPVLLTQKKVIPFSFGEGTRGSFPLSEFFGPIPGLEPVPYCGGPPGPGIDPGFGIREYFEGTRFADSFTAFPGLEHLLEARGGTLALQVRSTNGPPFLSEPLFTATLLPVANPATRHFTASLSGTNEVPPNASPHRGSASFALTGNCLSYNLALNLGLDWTSAGIYGPARPHSTSTNLVTDFGAMLGVIISIEPGSDVAVYSGSISLDDEAVKQLILGKLFVNLPTARYPAGEIRGQILPVEKADGKLNTQ